MCGVLYASAEYSDNDSDRSMLVLSCWRWWPFICGVPNGDKVVVSSVGGDAGMSAGAAHSSESSESESVSAVGLSGADAAHRDDDVVSAVSAPW